MSLTITRPAIPVPLPLARGGTEATNPAGARAKLELGDLALLTAPGGTTTFLRADKTWAVPAGGGGGAPTDAEYITSTTNATLSAERVLTDTATITWDRTVAGQIKANAIGGGGGDLSSNTASSVEGELALFTGTTGKLLKRSVSSGLARVTAGVMGTVTAPTGAVVGTTDTQTLTGKTIAGASNTLTVREADLSFTDIATANVSLTAHGLVPKAPGGTTAFLRGDATWAVPAGGGGGAPTDAEYITSTVNGTLSAERVLTDTATITWDRTTAGEIKANASGGGYTDEQAQDAIGAMLLDTATIDLTYTDATPSLSASVIDGSITEAKLSLSDVTSKDASTTAHGLLRKLSGTVTDYLNGAGAWTTPAGGGTNYWTRVATAPSYMTGCLAWWRLEEASGTRLDSVGSLALVPQGTVANLTTAAGKTGNALRLLSTTGTYLSIADNATMSVGANQSFTVALWVYWDGTPTSENGFVAKAGAAGSATIEYQWYYASGNFYFVVGNGATFHAKASGVGAVTGTWYLLIGWWDQAAGTINTQVNNATASSTAYAGGSHDSGGVLEVGRQWGYTPIASYPNGRIDNLMFWKRTLTTQERADLYNGGAGVDVPVATPPYLLPATPTDRLVLAAATTTQERLEIDGAIKVGTTTGTTDGTLRWSGTDMEARKGGAWVSMTGAGGGSYTDEQAQDAVGTILVDSSTIDFTYNDATPSITAQLVAGSVAPPDAPYLTSAAHAGLSAERVAMNGVNTSWDFSTPGVAVLNITPALGTMAQQDAANVAITGGTVGVASVATNDLTAYGTSSLTVTNVYGVLTANSVVAIPNPYLKVGAGDITQAAQMHLFYDKGGGNHGLMIRNMTGDTAGASALLLLNAASAHIGGIVTNATSTAYNTTSDARLKHAIAPLTGALDVVRSLRPITHRWKADDSRGVGFAAHEVAEVVDGVITGERDAVDEEGRILPQMIDMSKLVPFLAGAVQTLAAQVETLSERVTELENSLGL